MQISYILMQTVYLSVISNNDDDINCTSGVQERFINKSGNQRKAILPDEYSRIPGNLFHIGF